jgi:hypothetical protein
MPKTNPLIPRDMAKAILQCEREAAKILEAFVNTVDAQKLRWCVTGNSTGGTALRAR